MDKKRSGEFPLAGYTDELAERLRGLVPAALEESEVEAIHQARVTTRRLRAVLNLLGPVMPGPAQKPVAKALKRLRRRLGALRDLDVMLGHLQELRRYRKHAAAIGWLEAELKTRRKAAAEKAMDDIPPAKVLGKLGAWWGIREQIEGTREVVDSLLVKSLNTQLDHFAAAADLLTQPAQTEIAGQERANVLPAANPHEVRIAGKLLRYTVEMAEVEGHKLPKSVLRGFKKMQEALGMWHDFVVLTECAMAVSAEQMLAATDAAMQQRMLDLAQLVLKRSQSYLANFADLWRERGEEIGRAIREAFPLAKDATDVSSSTGSQMGLDLTGLEQPAIAAVTGSADPAAV